jgi:hypothetical protein
VVKRAATAVGACCHISARSWRAGRRFDKIHAALKDATRPLRDGLLTPTNGGPVNNPPNGARA